MTLPLDLYRITTKVAGPILGRRVARRLRAQGVPEQRLGERLGRASLPRPDGHLLWLHAASVGESLSILPLLDRLRELDPEIICLVTSGTASSASLLAERLPKGALHQFAPIDTPAALKLFLDAWRPDVLCLVESEIWPNMVMTCAEREIPVALINAHLSESSLQSWQRVPATARQLFGSLQLVRSQTPQTAERLIALGTDPAVTGTGGNMKAVAEPPPFDVAVLNTLSGAIGARPVWAAVSTHPGEEALVIEAHETVREVHPDALLLLVPRHPERAAEIEAEVGHALPRRSAGEGPGDAPVWLCDTLGETGLWFRLAKVTFLGGSLTPVGGHNPWEPATLDTAILHGPFVANAASAYSALDAGGATRQITAETLGPTVSELLSRPETARAMARHARQVAADQPTGINEIASSLLSLLSGRGQGW